MFPDYLLAREKRSYLVVPLVKAGPEPAPVSMLSALSMLVAALSSLSVSAPVLLLVLVSIAESALDLALVSAIELLMALA